MAEVRQLRCPACGAAIIVAVGANRATCDYCRSNLAVAVSHGEMQLRATAEIADAVREEGQRTQDFLRRMELRQQRIALIQDYTATRLQLDALDAELRALQRAQQTHVVRQQQHILQGRRQRVAQQLTWAQQQIVLIDAELDPQQPSPWADAPPPPAAQGLPGWLAPLAGLNGWVKALLIFLLLGFAIPAIGLCSPFLVLGTGALVVLAWTRPAHVERLLQSPSLGWLPRELRATPRRFALILAAVIIPLALYFGYLVYSPGTDGDDSVRGTPGRTRTIPATPRP